MTDGIGGSAFQLVQFFLRLSPPLIIPRSDDIFRLIKAVIDFEIGGRYPIGQLQGVGTAMKEIDKQKIREKLRRKRAQAFEADRSEGARAALGLAEMGSELVINMQASIVAGYIPVGSEIDPRPLMLSFQTAGASLCLPEVVEKGSPLIFRAWSPGNMLVSGLLGTLQPGPEQAKLTPDFVLVPLLGVDEEGVRLGQGGGFYDRTLPHLRAQGARAFGVAFDAQLVTALPREDHDQLLDGVITPSCCKVWEPGGQARYLAQS